MSIDEFNKIGFGANMRCVYMNHIYDIAAVNFKESLLALKQFDEGDDLTWVRCENITLLSRN